MLVILLLAADKNASSFMAPLPIGLALFVAELASGPSVSASLSSSTLSPSNSPLF
jgi:aquaporin related protein